NLENLKYTISPMSFFQSHWKLNQAVVKFVKDNLQPLRGCRVLDLYSGAGNFSLPVAIDADEVIAVEENPHAIKDGKRNLEINNIRNCRFIRSSAENINIRGDIDILIVDPPRLGLTNRAIDKILAKTPERIAYISCNPATLGRDLKKFLTKYELESVRMIDFFPQTYHTESLTFLRLR
ncbi:MAG: class I SAM-dependent RNA methyltransferase, partial [Nitrospirae bacterium]|nr:class I SAM-dependent RNA methyltransferase [Nitrospirota bacterium]